MRYQWRQFSEAISRPVEAHIEVQFSIIRGWVHSSFECHITFGSQPLSTITSKICHFFAVHNSKIGQLF